MLLRRCQVPRDVAASGAEAKTKGQVREKTSGADAWNQVAFETYGAVTENSGAVAVAVA